MRKNIKIIAYLLLFSIFVSCSSKPAPDEVQGTTSSYFEEHPTLVGSIPCKFPLVTENTSISVMTCVYDDTPAEEIYVWKKYAEMTGVQVNFTSVTKSERAERVSTALSKKQPLDLIIRCKISSNTVTQYGESGLVYDLMKDNLLSTYAPNCWKYLQTHPDALASVMNPDGTIYSLPQINSGAELRVSRKLFINKKWMEHLNLKVPSTTEEFYELLKAFKEQDANNNGDKDDEIPFCSQDFSSVEESLFGAFGLANRGIHNMTVDYDEENDEPRLIRSTEQYKSYLQYLNRLYTEKLIDQNVFLIKIDQWLSYAEQDRIGVFANTNLATLPSDKADQWIAIEDALVGPFGDKIWSAIRANFHSSGAALIPTTCERPDLILQWLDYFWTDEGTLFYHMGVESETYTIDENGAFQYSPKILEEIDSETASFDDIISRYSPYPGGSNPTVEVAPYFMGGEMAKVPAECARKLFTYGPKEYWPSFIFSASENERLTVIQSDLAKYCTTARIEFITGSRPFSEWNDYVDTIDQLGKSELLDIYQSAIDRYNMLFALTPSSSN